MVSYSQYKVDWWKGVFKQSVHMSYDMINDLQARNAFHFIHMTLKMRHNVKWPRGLEIGCVISKIML